MRRCTCCHQVDPPTHTDDPYTQCCGKRCELVCDRCGLNQAVYLGVEDLCSACEWGDS